MITIILQKSAISVFPTFYLPSEQMEILGAGCWVGHMDIHIVPIRWRLTFPAVRQREESFNMGTAMVRSSAIETMRQKNNQAILVKPFACVNY
jgi:hypothetical protein